MDNALYTTLNRQSGLMQEMQAVANNIANAESAGYAPQRVDFESQLAQVRQSLAARQPLQAADFAGVRPQDAPMFLGAQFGGALIAAGVCGVLFGKKA